MLALPWKVAASPSYLQFSLDPNKQDTAAGAKKTTQ